MNDRHDIEEQLEGFRHRPGGRVKKAVMDAYADGDAPVRGTGGFWRRPVPLYAAAAVAIVMVGLSFLAGVQARRPAAPATAVQPADSVDGVVTTQDIEWSVAERDLL